MNNPYKVLNLPQDATDSDIVRALIPALKLRKYSRNEITEAQTILRKPAARLAADFMFPVLQPMEEAGEIKSSICSAKTDLDSLDLNKYDSLNQ